MQKSLKVVTTNFRKRICVILGHLLLQQCHIKIFYLTLMMEKWQENVLQDWDLSLLADPVGGEPENSLGLLHPTSNLLLLFL